MPSIALHLRASTSPSSSSSPLHNPLPQLLQTPSGLALLEIQGTINVPLDDNEENGTQSLGTSNDLGSAEGTSSFPGFETPIGKLMFPDYSPQFTSPDDTRWMKRAYLYVGRYQRMTGEVKKLPKPLAVIQRRPNPPSSHNSNEELEVVEIVKYKLLFKSRPEPVNDI